MSEDAPLMISVAGVRGIVGRSLTPPVLARFAAAFAASLGDGPVVVGRDARISGPMVYRAVAAGLMAAGRNVVDLGLATTPATQLAVVTLHAAGGIILTASHNPAPWNALKFLSARGEFLDDVAGRAVRARFDAKRSVGFEGYPILTGEANWTFQRPLKRGRGVSTALMTRL